MTSHVRVRISALLAALGVSTAVLLGAAPAQAHDALTSTAPAQDETITANPGKVSLTLSKAPLDSDVLKTSVIKVTAPDGHVASNGDVTVEGAVISTAADIDHPGKYTVDWRAVSADGHPIEGSYTFTFAETGGATAVTAPAPATASSPAPAPTTTPASAQAATQESAASSTGNTGLLIAAGVIILGLIGAVVYLLLRRNKPSADA